MLHRCGSHRSTVMTFLRKYHAEAKRSSDVAMIFNDFDASSVSPDQPTYADKRAKVVSTNRMTKRRRTRMPPEVDMKNTPLFPGDRGNLFMSYAKRRGMSSSTASSPTRQANVQG